MFQRSKDTFTANDGRIFLINGDCIEWLPRIKRQAALIILDPPYYKVTRELWDNYWSTPQAYLAWCNRWLYHCDEKLFDTGSLYLWGQLGRKHQLLIDLFCSLQNRFEFQDWITWQKSRGLGNRKGWLHTREELLWFTKTDQYVWNAQAQYDLNAPTNRNDMGFNGKPRKSQFKRYTSIWTCNEDQNYGSDRITTHYTPKPLILIERIVNAHTLVPTDLVIDPFMGSGTTGVACVKLDRCFVGIEKDTQIFNAAVDRIQKAIR